LIQTYFLLISSLYDIAIMQDSNHITEEAIDLAQKWRDRANELRTHRETARQRKLARLFESPRDKIILTKLIDQSFRCADNRRTADQIHYLLAEHGIPGFFSVLEKTLMAGFTHAGRFLPDLTVPFIIKKMRRDSDHLIIPGETDRLDAFLQKRKTQGLRVNVNYIGEEVAGEQEARSRLHMYLNALENPSIEYISVKISTIFSQIQPLAFEHTVDVLKHRLSELYRSAAVHQFVRQDGSSVNKFVNLDMESYRDLVITTQAFIRTLDQEEFKSHHAGMALQAYLPDSYHILQQITNWARKRVAAGGSPVKIRIVKGANMEMEKIESAIFDWPLAPFDNKLEVDANWKRMVDYGMQPQNIRAVRLGIASHNLFDLAYAYLVARRNQVSDFFSFEMIEGMANHVRRAIQETGQEMVLYAPVATRDQFINAIGYLIRRLDENTGEENFLRHLNRLDANFGVWQSSADHFKASIPWKDQPAKPPHRTQNRLTEKFPNKMGTYYPNEFKNEPNTDWSLAANRDWAEKIRQKWQKNPADSPLEIPLVVAEEKFFSNREIRESCDPSQFNPKVVVARTALAGAEDIDKAVATAKKDPDGWRKLTFKQRHEILAGVAAELRRSRGDLIGAAAAVTGKVFSEADVEVSEAVDFAEYYPFSTKAFTDTDHLRCNGIGVGIVISPWNFPIAIPCGGIVAALAAGNTVIVKPSSEAIPVAWLLCQCFWRAGVSQNSLQFVPCSGSTTATRLTNHPDVDFIILTGGTDTGLSILRQRPDVLLAAETGGKNATIVTAMSDRDQAISNVIYSAFGNSGQKCSATSLLILDAEVYEDAGFKKHLVDAARSINTGSPWNFYNKMGPLIQPPRGDLKKALTDLEPGESWALQPQRIDDNPSLWTPGIKWGVRPQSYTQMTEFFGPLLGVMRADNLDHAIKLANQTGYGLTSGLESLDPREIDYWQERISAGNLYINRGTTGAVTLRQPFGGMGKSALGGGMKAGGPKYVAQFMEFKEVGPPAVGPIQSPHPLLILAQQWQQQLDKGEFEAIQSDIKKTIQAIKSYIHHVDQEFSQRLDYFHLRGQDNILRYLPVGTAVVRLHANDSLFETLARIAAAIISGCKLSVSSPKGLDNRVTRFLRGEEGHRLIRGTPIVEELDNKLIGSIPNIQRIRYAAPERVPQDVYRAAAETGFYIARTPVMMDGRIELLQYYRQQSICNNYHRYGNLGERANQLRTKGGNHELNEII
jgi:RHH-type transcriptional regulator, proline utilization regulon repressor / proline dehydrogenase / delta 1-pyrroline-5-carboxylate dehydrogenase